jgi:sulfate permease, SulP family
MGPVVNAAARRRLVVLVILAQSAATSRAYAAKYNERFDENLDLVGLSMANVATGVTGAFVVNGSPTKTQMVDGAGGHSQISQITTGVIVLIVLLFLTAPLAYMPSAVLASIVFLIGVELVDVTGMKRVYRSRLDEFVVAAITAAAVVIAGVEQGIVLAIVLSVIDHLRVGYHPNDTYVIPTPSGGMRSVPVTPSAAPEEAADGLVVYRFGSNLYYANANRFVEEVRRIRELDERVRQICIDLGSVGDIDYSGGEALRGLIAELGDRDIRLVFVEVSPLVRSRLARYGLIDSLGRDPVGRDAVVETVQDVMNSYGSGNDGS